MSIKPPELPPEVDEEVKHRNAFSQQFRVVCPNTSCNAKMKVMPEQLDRMLTCPICDKMFYLPCVHIECPNKKCDGAGYVPVHRLNTQLHCNVCKTQFYIDQGGRGLVTGEFTGEWVDPLYIPPPPKHKADIPERIIDWWSRLEKTTRTRVKLITALTLSSLLGFFVWWQFFGPKPKVPGEPLGRAQFVARAIMDNDVDKLRLVLDSKSNTSELREWLGLVRPKTWPKKLPMCNLECIESYKRSKFASYRVTYTTTYNPRPIMPPPEAELDEEATAEDESAEQGAEPIEGEDEFVEEEIVTEPVKIPKYSIVVTLVNRNDGGGYRLDMTECLRSVGKLKQ